MAAFNFPNSPSTNDIHNENGVSFKWNGTVWKKIGAVANTFDQINITGVSTSVQSNVTTLNVTGVTTFHNAVNLLDSDILRLGNDGDMQLYHTGSHSHVSDRGGTGNLNIESNNQVNIKQNDAEHYMATFVQGGAASLYHNNSKKFETSSYGTWLGDNSRITLGGSAGTPDCHLYADGTNTNLQNITGDLIIKSNSNGDKAIVVKNGAATEIYFDNAKKIETTTSGVNFTGDVVSSEWFKSTAAGEGLHNTATNMKFFSHGSNETRLYHAANAQIKLSFRGSGDVLRGAVSADASGMHILTAGSSEQKGVQCVTDGATSLYYSGSQKLVTTSAGVNFPGSVTLSSNAPSVKGALRISGVSDYSTAGGIEFHTSSGGGAGYGSRITSDASGNMHFLTRSNHSAWSERVRITADGKLFVGATGATGAESWLFRKDAGGGADGCRLTIYNADNSSVNNQAKITLKTNHSETIFSSYNQGEIYISNSHANAYFVTYLGGTEKFRITSAGVIESGPDTITGGTNLAIQNFRVKGTWSGSPSIGKEIELISGYDGSVKMAAIGYNLTDTNTGSTYGGDLVFHTQPLYSSPTSPIPESMRISSSGYVTQSKQPCFHVSLEGHKNATQDPLVFTDVRVNTGSHYSSSTGKFTAPVAGRYLFFFMGIKNSNNNQVTRVYVRKNNASIYDAFHCRMQEEGNYANGSIQWIMSLAVNDTVHLRLDQGGLHAAEYTQFGGYLIG